MRSQEQLDRALGLGAVLFYCFGDILGAGIYALVGKVAGVAGSLTPLAFLVAFAVASLTALCYAELGGRYPRSGLEVFAVRRAWGQSGLALVIGWLVLSSAVVSAATISHAFAGYLHEIFPGVPRPFSIAAFVLLAAAINFWGIEASSRTNIVLTLVEASGLFLVVAAGLHLLTRSEQAVDSLTPAIVEGSGGGAAGVVAGAALAFFAFVGFEDAINVAEEVRQPERVFPRALLGALGLAALLYILVSWVSIGVLSPQELARAEGPLLRVVEEGAPWVPAGLFTVVALLAVANTGLLNSITASRMLYGIARQRLLPEWLAAVHSGRRTPHRAVLVVLAVTLVLASIGDLTQLAGATAALLLTVFTAVAAALLTLRWRERRGWQDDAASGRGVRVPIVVPVLAMLSSVALAGRLPRDSLLLAAALTAVGVLVIGIGSAASRLRRRHAGDQSP